MAYMVHQRFASAIRAAYGTAGQRGEVERNLEAAHRAVAWLASLDIDDGLRSSLIEPIAVVEDAFRGLLARPPSGDAPAR
jgi:hypothetical protein